MKILGKGEYENFKNKKQAHKNAQIKTTKTTKAPLKFNDAKTEYLQVNNFDVKCFNARYYEYLLKFGDCFLGFEKPSIQTRFCFGYGQNGISTEEDYEGARNSADQVKTTAENIMSIFDNIDQVMNTLYNDAWQSQGAEGAKSRYQEIRKNYETFYNNVVAMKSHIYAVTASNEAQDAAVSNTIADL